MSKKDTYSKIFAVIKKRGTGFVQLDFKSALSPEEMEKLGPDDPDWEIDFCLGNNHIGKVKTSITVDIVENAKRTFYFWSKAGKTAYKIEFALNFLFPNKKFGTCIAYLY